MLRSFRGTAVVLVLLGLAAAGCLRRQETLRVGANVWPGYEPMYLARTLGHYDGKNLQLLSFPSAVDVMRAYRNRAIDVAAVTADEALLVAAGSSDHRVILVCDFSHGGDVILAQPSVESVRDLRGRRIGVEANALGAYVLSRALEMAGLTPKDVVVVAMELDAMEEAMAAARLDAVVTFDPWAARIAGGGAHRIFDSTQMPGEIMDLLITRTETITAAPRQLQDLIDGWFRAAARMKANPDEAATLAFPRERLSPKEFRATLDRLVLVGRRDNRQLLGSAPDNLGGRLQKLLAVMRQQRLLPGDAAVELRGEDRFVRGEDDGSPARETR